MTKLTTIYIKIHQPDLPPPFSTWFASHAYLTHESPAQRVGRLNRLAADQSLSTTYTLATYHEYLSYRLAVKAELAQPPSNPGSPDSPSHP